MSSTNEALHRIKTITFDCYGTLIDWKAGLEDSFRFIFGQSAIEKLEELFDVYVQTEAEVEAGPYRSYRDTLDEVARRIARRLPGPPLQAVENPLAALLPTWRPFADTNGALSRLKRHCRLGVLSNIDRDLFDATSRHFEVSFDFVITAEDVRSYKPADGHFQRAIRQHGPAESILHAAQSLFHDGVPAHRHQLAFAWINRYKQSNNTATTPIHEFPDLKSLADAVEAGR